MHNLNTVVQQGKKFFGNQSTTSPNIKIDLSKTPMGIYDNNNKPDINNVLFNEFIEHNPNTIR